MAFTARVFRLLVASPSDVAEERDVITDVIHEWNATFADAQRAVLLPVRWETHAHPAWGEPPQSLINRQMVDACDALIGVFWTRLGTPTGVAPSGTVEEIRRVANAGKPVMVYFSRAKVDLENIDINEYQRLAHFKHEIRSDALVEQYSSITELREKLTRQLSRQFKNLSEHDRPDASDSVGVPYPELVLAQGWPPAIVEDAKMAVTQVDCVDAHAIPDLAAFTFQDGSATYHRNTHYYREVVDFYVANKRLWAWRLGVKNPSLTSALHDVEIEATLTGDISRLTWVSRRPGRPDEYNYHLNEPEAADPDVKVGVEESCLTLSVGFSVVHAGRTALSRTEVLFYADGAGTIEVGATIYSSEAPPIAVKRQIALEVAVREMRFEEILKEAGLRTAG